MSNPISYRLTPLPAPSRLSTILFRTEDGEERDTGAVVISEEMGRAVMEGTGIPERVMTPDGFLFAVVAEVRRGERV